MLSHVFHDGRLKAFDQLKSVTFLNHVLFRYLLLQDAFYVQFGGNYSVLSTLNALAMISSDEPRKLISDF